MHISNFPYNITKYTSSNTIKERGKMQRIDEYCLKSLKFDRIGYARILVLTKCSNILEKKNCSQSSFATDQSHVLHIEHKHCLIQMTVRHTRACVFFSIF